MVFVTQLRLTEADGDGPSQQEGDTEMLEHKTKSGIKYKGECQSGDQQRARGGSLSSRDPDTGSSSDRDELQRDQMDRAG